MDEEIQRCAELKIEVSLLANQLNAFDVDETGQQSRQDRTARHILGVIRTWLGPADELSHDEIGKFFLLLLCTPKAHATDLGNTILDQLQGDPVVNLLGVNRISCSFAVVTYPQDGTSAAVLFEEIDGLLAQRLGSSS